MSGPKGVHYEVVSPEEQRRRAIAAAKSSIRARRAELEMLAARADAWPAARGEVAQLLSSAPSDLGEDLDALQRHAEQLAQSISRAESTLARAREQAERQAIAAAISQITISIDDPGTTRTLAATPARAVETSTAERRLAALAALVATHPEAGPEPSRQLLGLQQRLGGLTDTQSAALLDATQHSIVREIERHRGERALAEARQTTTRCPTEGAGAVNDIHPRMTGFPAWLATIDASLPVTAQYVLHGNLRDLHLLKAQPIPLEEALWRCLQANGYSFLLWYSPAGLRILPDNPQQGAAARSAAARVLGVQTSQLPARMTVADLPAVLQRLGAPVQAGQPALPHGAIALDYVSQWRPAGEPPSPEEHALMLAALARAHAVQAYPVADGPRPSALFQPVFWLVDRPGDLPTWLTGGSDGIRQVPVPMPDLQARTDAAQALTRGITQGDQETLAQAQTKAVKPFADATEGMTLKAMVQVVQLCNDRGLGPDGVTDAVRAHRIGVLENPWAKSEVRGRIRSAAATLRQQVFGQDRAIDHAVDILSRSSMGLTQAYRQEAGGGPRGILFFAGPTGVGKTELAKAITRMVFGDERAYIRLDMSEFSSEHTEARLIGSPPGYVGHGAGGELTNAVRQRPFSLVLFDEIEKAHPRIMDKFLQILSDGRLTDGSGSTVHFSECLIVFTSNLGIRPLADGETPPTGTAHETEVVDPAGGQQHTVVDLAAKFADQIRRDQLDGLSLTGGEPLQQASACTSLLDELATQLGTEPDVVLFTGYPLVTARRRAAALLDRCSVIVTGRYAAANPGTDPLVATANQQLTFRNEADRESYQAWADGRPRRLQVAVDDRDVFLVGIPRPRDLDDFAARLAERGVTFEP